MTVMCCCEESRNISHQALESDYCQNGLTDGTWQGSPYISADNLALLIASAFPFAWFSLFGDENFTVSSLIKRNTMSVVALELCVCVCVWGGCLSFPCQSLPEPEPKHSHGGGPSVELLGSDFPSRTLSHFRDLHPGSCYYPLSSCSPSEAGILRPVRRLNTSLHVGIAGKNWIITFVLYLSQNNLD